MGYLSQDDTDPYNPRNNITIGVIIAMAVGGGYFLLNYGSAIFGSGDGVGTSTARVEREMRMGADMINRQAPIRVDEVTTLTGATARGTHLTYRYALTTDVPADQLAEARAVLHREIGPRFCADPEMRRIVAAGGVISADYRDGSGDHVLVTFRTCAAPPR